MKPRSDHLKVVAVDGVLQEPACHRQSSTLKLLADLDVDGGDRLTLMVMRLLCDALAKQSLYPWEQAHAAAESVLGLRDGPTLVARMTALLRAIRAERQTPFSYMSALCPTCSQRLSEEEENVLLVLRAARLGRPEEVASRAAALAGAVEAPRITLIAGDIGRFLGGWEPRTSIDATPALVGTATETEVIRASLAPSERSEPGTC
jgi:hypothetical protein